MRWPHTHAPTHLFLKRKTRNMDENAPCQHWAWDAATGWCVVRGATSRCPCTDRTGLYHRRPHTGMVSWRWQPLLHGAFSTGSLMRQSCDLGDSRFTGVGSGLGVSHCRECRCRCWCRWRDRTLAIPAALCMAVSLRQAPGMLTTHWLTPTPLSVRPLTPYTHKGPQSVATRAHLGILQEGAVD